MNINNALKFNKEVPYFKKIGLQTTETVMLKTINI